MAKTAIAMFATNTRYKREAYRGSQFAPKVLADNGIKVIMKSDHLVLNSCFLLYKAQQAHYYGLDANLALASVTGTSAEVLGLDHRVGFIQEGHDADIVIWDSHPLSLGATPKQAYIDGIPQLEDPVVHEKPASFQVVPKTPDFEEEARKAVEYEGLPPLTATPDAGIVVFTNVAAVGKQTLASTTTVIVEGGKIVCSQGCVAPANAGRVAPVNTGRVVDLQGGVPAPGLVSFGSPLGVTKIEAESSTNDGVVPDALCGPVPDIIGGEGILIRASDGLQFGGRSALLANRSGVI